MLSYWVSTGPMHILGFRKVVSLHDHKVRTAVNKHNSKLCLTDAYLTDLTIQVKMQASFLILYAPM